MFIYWLFWGVISLSTFLSDNKILSKMLFIFITFILFLFVGFRFEIGVDRDDYLKLYQYIQGLSFKESMSYTDSGYAIVNYVGNLLHFNDLIFVNVVCAAIFFISFLIFSLKFKFFWVPLFVSYTYTIVVVSMNYIRQSVSISLMLLGIYFLVYGKVYRFIFLLLLASLFHKTAIILIVLLPIFYFNKMKIGGLFYVAYIILSLFFITILLYLASASEANMYVSNSSVSSSGAVFRSLLHFIPVFLYLYYHRTFKMKFEKTYLIIDYMMILIFYCLFLSFIFSTLADRFNLYLIFFDIIVYTVVAERLPLFNRNILFSVLFFYFTLTFFIWFNFGAWAEFGWIPYKNYIFNFLSNSI